MPARSPISADVDLHNADLARATLRRAGRRLLPFVFVLYLVNFLDRTNVAIAALQMNRDLGFSATAYGLGVGIFFLGYTLFQVPANLVLTRIGARRWIAAILVVWGVIAAAMLLVRTPAQFYAFRFALGASEAGFFPGIVFYLGQWFPSAQRGRAMSFFMLGIPVSSVVGGPLSGWLLGLDGLWGLHGWQWLFLLEGLPAVLLGLASLVRLTDRPDQARWLTDDQRAWLVATLRREQDAHPAGADVPPLHVLMNPLVWLLAIPYFLIITTGYAYTFWMPTFIRDTMHATDLATGFIVGALAATGAVGMVVVAAVSDRSGERVLFVALCAASCTIGFVGAALLSTPIAGVVSLSLVAIGATAFLPPFWCLPTRFLRGGAAAAGIAVINSVGNIGGFAGPYLVGFLKDATGGTGEAFLAVAGLALAAAVMLVVLSRHAAVRRVAPAAIPADGVVGVTASGG
jgi:MFS transporter, ACS family, tartrate transporter